MNGPTSRTHRRRTIVEAGPVPLRSGRNLVVIDDDAQVIDAVVRTLGERGYQATGLRDGRLAMPDRSRGVGDPGPLASADLVIIELVMPRVSGLDLIRYVRKTWSIPVIAVSVSGDHALRERAIALGAAAVLHKPFYLEELVALVRRLA